MKPTHVPYFALLCLGASLASAEDSTHIDVSQLHPFTGIGKSAMGSFTGTNGLLQLTAIASVPALIYSGTDTKVHNFYARHPEYDPYTLPAILGGYILPTVTGSGLLAYGWSTNSLEPYRVGCIVLQSSMLSFSWQSLLKLGTGREHPQAQQYPSDQASKQFRPGLNRGGIDWGWPSGLTMMNTSTLVALQTAYPESRALQTGAALWLGYTFLSTPAHEAGRLAWLSDAVSGTLMGIAIGRSVGKTFKDGKDESFLANHIRLHPILGSSQGLTAEVVF
ncbi:MAG: hypothetical protein RL318_914 [Fibrobacterota bacterium]|jgi:hypothetical protein